MTPWLFFNIFFNFRYECYNLQKKNKVCPPNSINTDHFLWYQICCTKDGSTDFASSKDSDGEQSCHILWISVSSPVIHESWPRPQENSSSQHHAKMTLEFICQCLPVNSTRTVGYVIRVLIRSQVKTQINNQNTLSFNLGEGQVSFLMLHLHKSIYSHHFTLKLLKSPAVCARAGGTAGKKQGRKEGSTAGRRVVRQATRKETLLSWNSLFHHEFLKYDIQSNQLLGGFVGLFFFFFLCFFFFFFFFLGLHLQYMEIPRLRVKSELQLPAYSHSHARSKECLWPIPRLTATPDPRPHWARPGIKPAPSWMLVKFINAEPQPELPTCSLKHFKMSLW